MSVRQSNSYLNLIATLIFIVFIFLSVFFVKSVDLLRFRVEKISDQLSEIQGKLRGIEKKLDSAGIFSGSFQAVSVPAGADRKEPAPIANLEFFDQKAEPGGRIITASTVDTKNMNSLINNESFVSEIWDAAYDSIAERNLEKLDVFEPKMAESWTLSEDKMVYTIKLRKGIIWHDFTDPVSGKEWTDVEVTAHDFKFYVDVIKDENTDCAPMRTYLIDLDKIEVINDYEFKVYWKKPYFLSETITLVLTPLPRHLYHAYDGPFDGKRFNDDHERNRIVVGCGPYRFDRWDKDQRIIMKKWEKYYGKNYGVMPPIDNIVFEIIKHPNTQFQSLLSCSIDRMGLTPDQWITRTGIPEFDEKTGYLKKFKYPGRVYSYIGYNMRLHLFQDKRVRQALSHLVDKERILKDVYYDLARITTGPFFMDAFAYDKSIKPIPFSVEQAGKLFKEAGWTDTDGDGILDKDGKKNEFTLLYNSSNETQGRMLPIIKEDMAKAGVVMHIVPLEWSVFVQRLENKSFEACCCGWAMPLENDPYQLWHSKEADRPASSNHVGFKNEKADKLIEQIRTCFDSQKRNELCHQFHQLLHEEQPYTFLFSPYSLVAQHKRYRNVHVFPGGIDTRIMWIPTAEQVAIPQGN